MHHWAVHFIFRHFVTNWNFFWTLRFLCGFPWAKKWAHAIFYVFLMSEWQSNSKKQVLNDCTAFCSLQSTSSASFGCCIYGGSSGEERRRCFNSLCILKATKLVLWLYRLKSQSSKKSKQICLHLHIWETMDDTERSIDKARGGVVILRNPHGSHTHTQLHNSAWWFFRSGMLAGQHMYGSGWQKLHGSTGGTRRKVRTQTKILSPNIRYFVPN